MKKLDLPFNITLLVLDEKQAFAMRPIRSLDTFVGSTKDFHPDGLFSTEIFGVVGTANRYLRYSYIDLKLPIIHPVIYLELGRVKTLYHDVLARREFAVWDDELKDLVKSNMADGETGFEFFCRHLPKIKLPENDSESRQMAIELLHKFRQQFLIQRIVILPPGYREFEIDENGQESSSEFNDFYYRLMAVSNTINPSTVRASIEAYDTQRNTMQNVMMELYELLSKTVEGKNGLLLGKTASRRVFNGTRNVLTSMNSTITKLGGAGNVGHNDTQAGLLQVAKGLLPVTRFQLKSGWIGECFTTSGAPVRLCDPETLSSKVVTLETDTYNRWLSSEGLEKLITNYREETIRHNPIEIEGMYLGLVYFGPDKSFSFVHGVDDLPEGADVKNCRPITMTDLLYKSLYPVAGNYHALVSRYPITGLGSVFPSRIFLMSTVETLDLVELDHNTRAPLYPEIRALRYPVHGSAFFNSMSPHPWKLARMGADHDGDQGSFTPTYSDESVQEIKNLFKSRKSIIGTDGRFIDDTDIDTVQFVLANMTEDLE